MKNNEKQFYLVDFQVLPEAIKKTIRIKESLKNGRVKTINEALSAMNISRSAYYKYKDHVEPVKGAVKERSITYFIMMQNDFSLLNKIMRKIKKENNDVLSINSGVAFGENVPTIISFKTKMTLADINLLAGLRGSYESSFQKRKVADEKYKYRFTRIWYGWKRCGRND